MQRLASAMAEPRQTSLTSERLAAWWRDGTRGPLISAALRAGPPGGWPAAASALPPDENSSARQPPDRPTPIAGDLPEVQALRLALQGVGQPMDTVGHWIGALRLAAATAGRRPLVWSAAEVATRCADLAQEGRGVWSLLEAVRVLWAWRPDGASADAQASRLLALLQSVLTTPLPASEQEGPRA